MATLPSQYPYHLPTAADLISSDETPVDNELQNDIPNLLLYLLREIWAERSDWFWGVDMGIYYKLNIAEPIKSQSIVPDGFLALGVEKRPNENGRLSYVLWQERATPILVLEVVSHEYNGEYDVKLSKYEELKILYYVIYNPLSGRKGIHREHQSLEVYRLVEGKYQLQPLVALLSNKGRMVWMPEIGLGIGCEYGNQGDWQREWVYWYDCQGVRYLTSSEQTAQERQARLQAEAIAAQEREKQERLAAYLRSLGINPDDIGSS